MKTVPGKVMVRADKTQMNRLFTNLIQNAIEACNGKGKCNIELNEVRTDGVIQISIKDNGEGIPKKCIQRYLFQILQLNHLAQDLVLPCVKE